MSAMEWIKCSDRLPEEDGVYIVYRPGDFRYSLQCVGICRFTTDLTGIPDIFDEILAEKEGMFIKNPGPGWYEETIDDYGGEYDQHIFVDGITHWMPLPEPPTDD